GLAGAVGADHREPAARRQHEAHAVDGREAAEALRDPVEPEVAPVAPGLIGRARRDHGGRGPWPVVVGENGGWARNSSGSNVQNWLTSSYWVITAFQSWPSSRATTSRTMTGPTRLL